MKGSTLYHLSPIRNRESILKNGLIPQSKNGKVIKYHSRLYLFSDKKNPPFDVVSHFNVDIWEVKVEKKFLKEDEFMTKSCGGGNCFYVEENIKPLNIKLTGTFI